MLVLKKRGDVRLELSPARGDAPAITVTIAPIGQTEVDVANGNLALSLAKGDDAAAMFARMGLALASESLDAVKAASKVGDAMLALQLGIAHIRAWEGMGAETGEKDDAGDPVIVPAPLEPALISLLFNEWAPEWREKGYPRESYASRFMRLINGLSTLEPGAKKGSGVSPVTASAAAPKSAAVADS